MAQASKARTGDKTDTPSGRAQARAPRLATTIAHTLEERIVRGGWPVGHFIGREAELVAEFGVSRWTFRDAVRMLSSRGLVTTRKGTGGGLYVASSGYESVCMLAANYLAFVRVDPREYAAALAAILRLALADVAADATPAQLEEIRETAAPLTDASFASRLKAAGETYRKITGTIRNPALHLFIGILDRFAYPSAMYSDFGRQKWIDNAEMVAGVIGQIAGAVLERDRSKCEALASRYADLCGELYASSRVQKRQPIDASMRQRMFELYPPARPLKKVDAIEIEIGEMINNLGWEPGVSLGSEKELAARFGVGRWVMREALRSMEQLGVVEMGRGSRSGLRILTPDPRAILKGCRQQLHQAGLTEAHAAPLRELFPPVVDGVFQPLQGLFSDIIAARDAEGDDA